jgi:branched-chain amino acid transport system substrate-binding protein
VALIAVAALLAACSHGGNSTTASKAAPKPTGPPIVLGMINMENTPLGSFPEVPDGARAAVRYVNDELGGVGGRPLQLEVCTTVGTPESSQACANRLLEKRPVAVLGGVDLGARASLPVLEQARIPYVGGTPTLVDEMASDTSFMLSGGIAGDLLGEAAYLTGTLHAKKVGVVHLDLPGLITQAVEAGRQILKEKGVDDVRVVAEKADAADFTAALSAVAANQPDVILAIFPAQGCSRIMQAKAALGIRAKMFYPGVCAAQSVFDAAGGGAEGAYFATGFVPYSDPTDKNVALYRDRLARYGSRAAQPSELSEAGFGVTMDVSQLLGEVNGELTPAALISRLKAASHHPSFLGHNYTCNGRQVSILSSLCAVHVRLLQYQGATLQDVVGDWVTGGELFDLVAGPP